MSTTNTSNGLATRPDEGTIVTMGFGSLQSFEFMQRTARMFSSSSMVPTAYRAQVLKKFQDDKGNWQERWEENPSALPNCMIALNMSQRMNADPLMIMQNLHAIEGRPSWSSQFIIAAINSCGRYSPLRFDMVPGEEIEASCTTWDGWGKNKKAVVTTVRVVNVSCVAWAIELATNTRLESPKVSMEMAVNEGWYGKNGSKWQSMPDLMLRYRSAAFFGRIYAPELLMGLPSAEEARDIIDVTPQADGSFAMDPVNTTSPQAPARASTAEDVHEKPSYPADQFATNIAGSWKTAIKSGKKTPDQIIAMAESKHPLTDAQKDEVKGLPALIMREVEKEAAAAATTAGPVITYATVADKLRKAEDVDLLDAAADLIGEVADAGQRAELAAIFDSRTAELRG